jgi:hypothetical protein
MLLDLQACEGKTSLCFIYLWTFEENNLGLKSYYASWHLHPTYGNVMITYWCSPTQYIQCLIGKMQTPTKITSHKSKKKISPPTNHESILMDMVPKTSCQVKCKSRKRRNSFLSNILTRLVQFLKKTNCIFDVILHEFFYLARSPWCQLKIYDYTHINTTSYWKPSNFIIILCN